MQTDGGWGGGGMGGAQQLCLNYLATFPHVEVTSGEASVVFERGLHSDGPSALTHSSAAVAFVSLFACALFMK